MINDITHCPICNNKLFCSNNTITVKQCRGKNHTILYWFNKESLKIIDLYFKVICKMSNVFEFYDMNDNLLKFYNIIWNYNNNYVEIIHNFHSIKFEWFEPEYDLEKLLSKIKLYLTFS